MNWRLPALVCLIALVACGGGPRADVISSGSERLPPGTFRRTLEYQGRGRSYLAHLPSQADSEDPLPVVLNFHGGGGNAAGQESYSRMDSLADEEGFIVAYPDGTGRFPGVLLTWNAGGCCGYARDHSVDDVGFVRALLSDLAGVAPVDTGQIYATGLSNGAMMAYRLAAEAPDLVAAIAPVAGAMQLDSIAPGRPIPLLHFHSVDDPRALYYGGWGPPFPLTTSRVEHIPVDAVLSAWAENNGCSDEPLSLEVRRSTDDPLQEAEHLVYPDCDVGGDVELWRMTGVGHVWPGGEQGYLESILGPSSHIIDANAEAWAFFRRSRLSD